MDVTAPDGHIWRVFRRWLTWRTRLLRWIVRWCPEGWPDDSAIGLIVGTYATFLLIIMSPFLLWYVLSWLVALAAAPIVWLARSAFDRPIPVIACRKDQSYVEWTAPRTTAGRPTTWSGAPAPTSAVRRGRSRCPRPRASSSN